LKIKLHGESRRRSDHDQKLLDRFIRRRGAAAATQRSALFSRSLAGQQVSEHQERRPGKARRALNRSCSVPDSNNPPTFCPPSHAPISMMVADLSEITEEESAAAGWSGRLRRPKAKDSDLEEEEEESGIPSEDATGCTPEPDVCETDQIEAVDAQSPTASEDGETCADAELCSTNHVNRTVLCLNEESQNQ
ncbi:hypothetical protein M9458_027615, partial [Cirrhinus mrigala]